MTYNKNAENISNATDTKLAFYHQLIAVCQALKNSQRCYADATTLARVSTLRNFFARKELEKVIFLEEISKALTNHDLTLHNQDFIVSIFWFASLDVMNVSKDDLHKQLIERCLESEDLVAKHYKKLLNMHVNEDFQFLERQDIDIQQSRQILQQMMQAA